MTRTRATTTGSTSRFRFIHLVCTIGFLATIFSLNGCTGAALASKSAAESPNDGSLKIASNDLPSAVVQNAYATSVKVTGGEPPYKWNIDGQLPTGISFNAETGDIAGTTDSVGTFPITTTVRDAKAASVSQHFRLTVAAKTQHVEIVGGALPQATAQSIYIADLSVTGGVAPYNWSVSSGTLPAGVSLNSSTGAITGTPTTAGTFPFIATVRDAKSSAVSAGFAISVAAKASTPTTPTAPLHITNSSLPAGIVQAAYSASLEATGGVSPYIWNISNGALPTGLNLNAHAGMIAGAPGAAGTFSFTLTVHDSKAASLSTKFSLVIAAKPASTPAPKAAPLKITTTSLPTGTATQIYTATLSASGGSAPYAWSSGGQLPAGLTLNSSTGVLSGAPKSAGNFSFSVNVKDSKSASASSNLSLNVSTEPAPSIASLSPNSTSSTASTTVAISGTNFHPGVSVQFGSVSADTVLLTSTTQLRVTIHSQAAGKVNVVVKNTDGQSATAKSAFTFSAPAAPAPQPSAPSANLQPAQSADAFVDSTGVNLHLHFTNTPYTNFSQVKTALQNLGVRHVRDGLIDTTWTTYYDELNQLGRAGMKATLTTTTSQSSALLISYPSRVADAFEAYEAPNELDLSGNPNWSSSLNGFLGNLHSAVKSSTSVSQFPIVGPSLTQQNSYAQVMTSAPDFDDSNIHDYPGGRNPGTPGWGSGGYGSIAWNKGLATNAWISKPVIATETGYVTDVNQTGGVPEDIAGRYMPRIFLEQWLNGINRTYIYELVDVGPNGGDNNYGLLHSNFSPKPGYTAVSKLLNLLADPGPAFQPTGLDYTLSGNTANVHHLLLQKRDGTCFLAIWVELPSYDVNTKKEISVPSQQVTITTGESVRINTHTLDVSGNMSTSTLGIGKTQTLQVSDLVTVLEIFQ